MANSAQATNDEVGIVIRRATVEDLPALVAAAAPEFRRVAPQGIDPEHTLRLLGALLIRQRVLILVAEADGELAGGVVVLIAPSLWSADVTAEELVLFVRPSHRRSGLARSLMAEAIAWAVAEGATAFGAAAECGLAGGQEMFESLGFVPQEMKLSLRIGGSGALLQ